MVLRFTAVKHQEVTCTSSACSSVMKRKMDDGSQLLNGRAADSKMPSVSNNASQRAESSAHACCPAMSARLQTLVDNPDVIRYLPSDVKATVMPASSR